MTFDSWKATNPDDETLGPEPPPCMRPTKPGEAYKHARYPSGWCVACGAAPEQGCRYRDDEEVE